VGAVSGARPAERLDALRVASRGRA